ncbi:MAG: Crp/Fnr family transcriptional regulator [Candidatus Velthaea sp.]
MAEVPAATAADRNKVWYLQRNRLFIDTVDADVESNQHIFTVVEHPRRTLIFDQGDPSRLVYFVKRGSVRIARLTEDGKEVTVAVLGPGDLFGEETLFGNEPRTTVAIAVDDVLLCTAQAEALFHMLRNDPRLALNVAKVLSERLGDAVATMEDLAYAKIPDRLMHVFRRLALEHGTTVEDGLRIDVRLTHADIASLIGSTRETVSLEMTALVRAGRLRLDTRNVIVPKGELS